MKRKRIFRILPPLTLCLGVFGFGLRWMTYLLATDGRGLLVSGHFLNISLWLFTFGVLGFLAAAIFPLSGDGAYGNNFFPSLHAAVGHAAMTLGTLLTVLLYQAPMAGNLSLWWKIFGFLSVPCFLGAGWYRLKGKQPFFLLHLIPCLFLVFHIVNQYRGWSSQPQFQDSFFAIFGNISLLFFTLYNACFDVDLPRRRLQLGSGLAALFLCLTGLYTAGEDLWLHLGAAAYCYTGLCALRPKPLAPKFARRKKPEGDGSL